MSEERWGEPLKSKQTEIRGLVRRDGGQFNAEIVVRGRDVRLGGGMRWSFEVFGGSPTITAKSYNTFTTCADAQRVAVALANAILDLSETT